jgi:hypothetical protein
METRCRLAKLWFNTGLAKVAVQCSADTFMFDQIWFSASTFVVKIATLSNSSQKMLTVIARLKSQTWIDKETKSIVDV